MNPQRMTDPCILDDIEGLTRRGLSRIIGIEIKVQPTWGNVVELGMWVPPRELLLATPRVNAACRLNFPCTIHTSHGDLNYSNGGEVR